MVFPDREKLNLLAVLLRDNASNWFDMLPDARRVNWNDIKRAFKECFQESDLLQWQKATDLWNRVQSSTKTVDAYITAM